MRQEIPKTYKQLLHSPEFKDKNKKAIYDETLNRAYYQSTGFDSFSEYIKRFITADIRHAFQPDIDTSKEKYGEKNIDIAIDWLAEREHDIAVAKIPSQAAEEIEKVTIQLDDELGDVCMNND